MQNYLQAWKSFLFENKQLLQEFDREDLTAVEEDGDSFTVSYEIELESADSMLQAGAKFSREDASDKVLDDPDRFEDFIEGIITYEPDEIESVIMYCYDKSTSLLGSRFKPEDPIYTMSVPFVFGLQALASSGQLGQMQSLYQGYADAEKLNHFIQAAFLESQPLFSADAKRVIERDILRHNKELGEWASQNQIESIFDAYGARKLTGPMEDKLIETLSEEMEIIQANYLFNFRDGVADFAYMAEEVSMPIEVFMTIFGASNFFKKATALGNLILSTVANANNKSSTLGEYSETLTSFIGSYSLDTTPSPLSIFMNFYVDVANTYVDEIIDSISGEDGEGSGIDHMDEFEIEKKYREALKTYLPRFYSTYANMIKVESDASLSLERGLEFSMDTYLEGLDAAKDFLNSFYDEFEKQEFFFMSKKTGLHINVGYKGIDSPRSREFNLVKGYLFLNEKERARKGLGQLRKESHWAKPLADSTKAELFTSYLGADRNKFASAAFRKDFAEEMAVRFANSLETGDPSDIEEQFNDMLIRAAYSAGPKNIGFNINYAREKANNPYIKYIEFRYPGHEVDRSTALDLTNYYCHIVKTMSDPDYKKEEYIKKFIGLLNLTAESQLKITKQARSLIKPGMVVYSAVDDWWYQTIAKGSIRINYSGQEIFFAPAMVWNWLMSIQNKTFLPPRSLKASLSGDYYMPVKIVEVNYDADDSKLGDVRVLLIHPTEGNSQILTISPVSIPMNKFLSTFTGFGMNKGLQIKAREKQPSAETIANQLASSAVGSEMNVLALRDSWNKVEDFFKQRGNKVFLAPGYEGYKK